MSSSFYFFLPLSFSSSYPSLSFPQTRENASVTGLTVCCLFALKTTRTTHSFWHRTDLHTLIWQNHTCPVRLTGSGDKRIPHALHVKASLTKISTSKFLSSKRKTASGNSLTSMSIPWCTVNKETFIPGPKGKYFIFSWYFVTCPD